MANCRTCRAPRSGHTRADWLACSAWGRKHCMICRRPHSAHSSADRDRCHTSCFTCKQPTDGHTDVQAADCARLREERQQRQPKSPYCGVCLLEWDHPAALRHVECVRRAELPIDVCHICARPMEDHTPAEVEVCAASPFPPSSSQVLHSDACRVCGRPLDAHTPSQVETCSSAFATAMRGRPFRAWLLRFPLNPRLWAMVALLLSITGWRTGAGLWSLVGFLLVCGLVHTVLWNTVKKLSAVAALLAVGLLIAAAAWSWPWLATWWPFGITVD